MFDGIFDAIEEWMRELLTGMISSNLDRMFTDVNQKTGEIASQVGQTPQGWNGSIFSMIQNLSTSVILPIAGMIITFVLCYELISMLTERNNMHDMDTWMFFKYFVKMWIAVYLVSNTFTITMAIFDVAQSVVNSAAGLIGGDTALNIDSIITNLDTTLEAMEVGELVVIALETLIVSFCMKIMSVVITVILYGRMIEIYLYTSVAPIPFATMSNREWGQIGTNYLRGLFALAFQAFLMMVCVAIYAVLVANIAVSDNLSSALFGVMAYTVILCFSLFKTSALSKSIFNAH
ncbi:MAG: CD0415/CD1112 family protein [Anaerostipes sp.]|nr:CD0415/CD1112 family protein [Anaerostipes sp.]MDD3746294.1 CD0415/CD1112 family protein [Anaerostipes sp.]